jgi:hypothetical protein
MQPDKIGLKTHKTRVKNWGFFPLQLPMTLPVYPSFQGKIPSPDFLVPVTPYYRVVTLSETFIRHPL